MGNHFHLVLELPNGNREAEMEWFLGAYASRSNHRHKLFGHLFGGRRYQSLVVDATSPGYLRGKGARTSN